MFPCPNGEVPYSLQKCYNDAGDWPSIDWVAKQIKDKKIDYFGEVLGQYYGISSSDSLLYPYYALAEKNQLPVGVHTGGAGPDHGSPNFKMEMGNPLLLQQMLKRFPKLKVWIMHSGEPFLQEAISVMRDHKTAYCDISAISNPRIVPEERFHTIMKSLIDAGLEDRIMFGSDNGDIVKVVSAVYALDFLSEQQKDKIFFKNAEKFFSKK
jgi:predicted TIM-barrel fold metal-dependent hydrolase